MKMPGLSEKPLISHEKFDVKGEKGDVVKTASSGNGRKTVRSREDTSTRLKIGLDIFLAIFALAFFLFGCSLLWTNRTSPDDNRYSKSIFTLARLGPTIFPILFAAICGRLLKAISAWKIENGASIGFLEQLMGSRNIVSTIMTQSKLRAFNLPAILLILLWSLSPLGGQAVLRAASTDISVNNASRAISYLDINTHINASAIDGTYDFSESVRNQAFLAALASSSESRRAAEDIWGNVRIPMLEYIPGYDLKNDTQWLEVKTEPAPVFSSLIGIPMSFDFSSPDQTASLGDSSMLIDTAYWLTKCSPYKKFNLEQEVTEWQTALGTEAREIAQEETNVIPRTITLDSSVGEGLSSGGPGFNRTLCSITTSYVQVEISCTRNACTSLRIRRSPIPHPVSAWTVGDTDDALMPNFLMKLNQSFTADSQQWRSTPLEGYIVNPDAPILTAAIGAKDDYLLDMSAITEDQISTRFAQLLNTYWTLLLSTPAVLSSNLAGPGGTLGEVLEETFTDTTFSRSFYDVVNTTANASASVVVLQYHPVWLGLNIVISLVLFTCALAALIFGSLRRGPDILDSFSSLTRDNPFVTTKLDQAGSHLNGVQRARLLRDVRVQLGDVAEDKAIGHIAIGTQPVARLRKSRHYD